MQYFKLWMMVTVWAFTALYAASPVFNATKPNVWIVDNVGGGTVSTFNFDGSQWSVDALAGSPTEAKILLDDGSDYAVSSLDTLNQSILTNMLNRSYPLPDVNAPQVSISGISAALSSNDTTPSVSIAPAPGVYSETIEVRLKAVSARNLDPEQYPVTFYWDIDGKEFSKGVNYDIDSGFEVSFHLVANGEHKVTFHAEQNGETSEKPSVTFTIKDADTSRDTDGDGIPDSWEAEHGLDPFSDSFTSDGDGDGWSDFDEALRDSDPNDPDSTPLDSDLDGWSDFDEERLRETDKNDPFYLAGLGCDPEIFHWASRPNASRLYEVEHNLSGSVNQVSGELKSGTSLEVSVMDVAWDSSYDSAALWNADKLLDSTQNGCIVPIDPMSLPTNFQQASVKGGLALGALPHGLRVPAGLLSTVTVQEWNATTGETKKWVVKEWLPVYEDLVPATVTQALLAKGAAWATAQEWEDDLIAYLKDNLVQKRVLTVSPQRTLPVAMLETLMAWTDGDNAGPNVLLGNALSRQPLQGIDTMRSDLASRSSSLDLLYTHLRADLELALMAPFKTNALALYAEDANLSRVATIAHALGNMLQLDDGNETKADAYDETAVYLARLQYMMEPELLSALDSRLTELEDDFDNDTQFNKDELLMPYDTLQTPDDLDSDDDGLNDKDDPCPVDPSNRCIMEGDLFKDSDGDGVPDYADNCIHDPNPEQQDVDGNGFGGKCDYYVKAQIKQPATDMTIFAGGSVWLEAVLLAYGEHTGVDEVLWDIDGNDEVSGFGPVRYDFPVAGEYEIMMSVDGEKVDYRTITVLPSSLQPPKGVADSYVMDFGTTLIVDAGSGVLANDSDPDSTIYAAELLSFPSKSANFRFYADGSFSYEHDGVSTGDDQFTYRVYDGHAYSDETTVSIQINNVDQSDLDIRIAPVEHLFGTAAGEKTFTVVNSGADPVSLPAAILRGAQANRFSIVSDGCNGLMLASDESCSVTVGYPGSTDTSLSAYLQVNNKTAFLHNYESIDEEAARRLPPVMYAINIPETMNSGTTYDISWSIVGYDEGYISYVAFFDCTQAPEGECGAYYSQTSRFDEGLGLVPDLTEQADWSYLGVPATKSTYSFSFTPDGFTAQTPIVIRFYYKSLKDDTAGQRSISLIIPGNLSEDYYDTSGRKIQKTICPSGGCQ